MVSYQTEYEVKKLAIKHFQASVFSLNRDVLFSQNKLNELREQLKDSRLDQKQVSEIEQQSTTLLVHLTRLAAARKVVQNVIDKYRYS